MKEPKLHSGHIELAVAELLNWRIYTIVPNVSWGLGLNHECDMLALDQKGRFTEIEIKVTASDLKADFKKTHDHSSKYIGRLIYAMPEAMVEKYSDIIPPHCGIISVGVIKLNKYRNSDLITYQTLAAKWVRNAKHNKYTEVVPVEKKLKFMSLGCMRIWDLKRHNNRPTKPIIEYAKQQNPVD